MENWKRKIFFWILVLLFFITVPVVILNAKGYRFDKNRGVFVHSGTITFKSNPQTVEAKLDEELFESKKINRINSSYNLSGLIPGTYNFQISAENFWPWSKKVEVHSGVASEFWNVLLVRKNYEKTEIDAPGIQKFFTSPKNDLLSYTLNSDNNLVIKIFNISSAQIEKEFSFAGWQFIIDESRKENIEWSPEESFISIPVEKTSQLEVPKNKIIRSKNQTPEIKTEYNYFIADIANDKTFDLRELLKLDNIRSARWDSKEKGFLFFLNNDILYRVDINNVQDISQIATDVSSYDISGSEIFYSKIGNGLLFKNNLDGKADPVQITSNFPDESVLPVNSMVIYDDSRMAIISKNGDLFIYNEGEHDNYFRKIGSGIQEAHFSNDGKKLLFWSNNEISVYFLRDQTAQPIRSENEMETVTRYSEPIKNIQWFSDYEHIIFSSGKWIKIIEIDLRDRANCMDLLNTETTDPFVIYNNSLEKLYFTDTKNEISNLYSIDFPEKTSLLQVIGIGG
ncbi:MAG TPA: hypothetical protein P5232_00245 [Candidatus Moranbacteria bacterium]|nr:hypothetical protein [Candidatus Moranbacteria bacterium]